MRPDRSRSRTPDWKSGHKKSCGSPAGDGAVVAAKAVGAKAAPKRWTPFRPDAEVERQIDEGDATCIPCTGLANVGNTCFLNCIMQCLLHGPLWHYLLGSRHAEECAGCIFCDLVDLARQYAACPKGKWIAPRTIARRMLTDETGMDFGQMHDAHEFMVRLATPAVP